MWFSGFYAWPDLYFDLSVHNIIINLSESNQEFAVFFIIIVIIIIIIIIIILVHSTAVSVTHFVPIQLVVF